MSEQPTTTSAEGEVVPAYHRVEFTLHPDSCSVGTFNAAMRCLAPEGGWCRLSMDCDCDADEEPCGHPLTAVGGPCVVLTWNCGDSDQVVEAYRGEVVPVHDGAVDIEWDGSSYIWDYSEQVSA